MSYRRPLRLPIAGVYLFIALFVASIVSCGDPTAPAVVDKHPIITPLPVTNTETTPNAEATASPSALPTAIAQPTGVPQQSSVIQVRVAINVGISELGSLEGAADPKELGSLEGAADPKELASPVLGRLNMTVYETLVVSAPNGDLVPRLAEDWRVSPDGLTWTFSIQHGVPFHGTGEELSADDVAWT